MNNIPDKNTLINNTITGKIKIPNSETIKAIEDLENNIDVTEYNSVDDYFKVRKDTEL